MTSPRIRRVDPTSRTKFAHAVHVVHRDQVEPPLTDWIREAYDVSPELSPRPLKTHRPPARKPTTPQRK